METEPLENVTVKEEPMDETSPSHESDGSQEPENDFAFVNCASFGPEVSDSIESNIETVKKEFAATDGLESQADASSSRTPRKKYSKISMDQKSQALKRLDRGDPMSKIAADLGIQKSTVCAWKVNRKKIEKWCEQTKNRGLKSRSRMRAAMDVKLDEAVFAWFTLLRRQGTSVAGPMIQNKAVSLNQQMGGDSNFVASTGWLKHWKQRYGIKHLVAGYGEKPSANASAVNPTGRILQIIEDERLTRDQLFSCEESCLCYKILPSKTLAPASERSAKINEDRVTLLICGNASGSLKLPLMVIGKSAKPKSLKDLNMDEVPLFYRNQRSAWMDSALFSEWFHGEFVPRVTSFLKDRRLPLKALLIVDNAPVHLREEDLEQGNIKGIFIPPKVYVDRPKDRGALESLKRRFRYRFISSVLRAQKSSGEIFQHLKIVTMKNVIFWLVDSWEEVASSALEKSWLWLLPKEEQCSESSRVRDANECEEPSDAQFLQAFSEIEVCRNVDVENLWKWIEKDDEAAEFLSDQELISLVGEDEDDETENGNSSDGEAVTAAEARDGMIRAISFFEKLSHIPTEKLTILHWFRDAAASMTTEQTEDK